MNVRVFVFVALALVTAERSADACSVLTGFSETAPREAGRIPRNGVWFVNGFDVDPVRGEWLDFDVFIPLQIEQRLNVYELHNPASYYMREAQVSVSSGRDNVEPLRREFRVVQFEDEIPPEVTTPEDLTATYQLSNPAACIIEGWHVSMVVPRI